MKKVYYQCTLTQRSPLRIGSGSGDNSDSDVIKDSHGLPFIPGTGLAGAIRALLPQREAENTFGIIRIDTTETALNRKPPIIRESHVLVNDGVLVSEVKEGVDYIINMRDGVALSDEGTAIKGAKYDFEAVECSDPYTSVLETADDADDEDIAILEIALRRMITEGLKLGAGTTRGYGDISVEVRKKEFIMPGQVKEWEFFDPYSADAFAKSDLLEGMPVSEIETDALHIQIGVKVVGSFTVRVYTTVLPDKDEDKPYLVKAASDQIPLTAMEKEKDGRGKPTIPGTSWSGSFRHHMHHLAESIGKPEFIPKIDDMFGIPGPDNADQTENESSGLYQEEGAEETRAENKSEARDQSKKGKSDICFSETVVSGSKVYTITRTAIDRFTASPSNRELFTSAVAQGGETLLTINVPKTTDPILLKLLAVAINDLHIGLLTVGGEAGVGRGVFEITSLKVNGKDKFSAVQKLQAVFLDPAPEEAPKGGE